jgi:kynurenine formamidase
MPDMGPPAEHTGAADRIGKEETLSALRLPVEGRVYDLGMDIDERMPMGPPEAFPRFSRAFCATPGRQAAPFDYAAEVIVGTLHTSTHIDALVHVMQDGVTFGGHAEADIRGDRGFTLLGAETIAPILTRGIVLDVAAGHGVDALPDGYEISVGDVRDALGHAGLEVADGDVVLVRTGKIRDYHADPDGFHAAAPGIGADAAIWLHDRGMAALAIDTAGTDPAPFPDPEHTAHVAMLVERGVHLIENVNLENLATDAVRAGLFICLPLRLAGATGSWVRPVLVV